VAGILNDSERDATKQHSSNGRGTLPDFATRVYAIQSIFTSPGKTELPYGVENTACAEDRPWFTLSRALETVNKFTAGGIEMPRKTW
jgi:hypothetical protein